MARIQDEAPHCPSDAAEEGLGRNLRAGECLPLSQIEAESMLTSVPSMHAFLRPRG
jgi:hypothetical protein